MSAEVRLFGSFSVTVDGRTRGVREFGGRKPKQLLEILALRAGRPVPKERLALMLWGDEMPASPNGALEHYVSLLRRRLGPNVAPQQSLILTEQGGYRFDAEKAWVDVHAFDEVAELAGAGKVGRPDLERALGWVRGDLLEDEPYTEWVLDARMRHRQRHVRLLVTAADLALADRDFDAAHDFAQAAVTRDSLVESGYRVLMLAAYARGEQGEALRTFQQLRRVLADELGIDPMPTTAELHQSMLGQAAAEDLLPPPARQVLRIPRPLAASRRQVTVTARPPAGGSREVTASLPQPRRPEGAPRRTTVSPLHVAVLQERLRDLGVLRMNGDGDGFSFEQDDQQACAQ